MRSALGFFSFLLIAAGMATISLPSAANTGRFSPPPLLPQEEIPMAEPIQDEPEYIPEAEPIPGETQRAATPASNRNTLLIPQGFSSVPVPQHETRVAILGYHDFSETLPATEMRINTQVFRNQMQALKNAGVPFISMKELLDWKLGDRMLPPKCVMITIDDGWKSVYTDAYPILKEMGIPFTVFPYTNFITGRGSAMSTEQIQEMINNGATLGSHSISHLYPKSWRTAQRKGTQTVLDLAKKELEGSRTILQEKFPGSIVEAYCYPGGFVMPEMIAKAEEAGYQGAFTVIPKKVTKETDRWKIHRYMIFGKDPKTFTRAVDFSAPSTPEMPSTPMTSAQGADMTSYPAPAQPVTPAANIMISNQCPEIGISLAAETDCDPKTLEMRVSGFGQVDAAYDEKEKLFKWIPARYLRFTPVTVQVRWRTISSNSWQTVTWQFGVTAEKTRFIPQGIVK